MDGTGMTDDGIASSFHFVNPVAPLSPACSFRTEQRRSHAGVPHLHVVQRKRSITPRGESRNRLGAQLTGYVHACLYARDGLSIPLDRCDLRMLERA